MEPVARDARRRDFQALDLVEDQEDYVNTHGRISWRK